MRAAWLSLVFLVACGAGSNDVKDPQPTPGGGVGGGEIDGELNVFVVDDQSGAAISGATVRLEAEGAPLLGTTDGNGFVRFADVSGAQTVTVQASGHVTTTWIGVRGAVLTMNLDPLQAGDVPSATVSGTIAGWGNLPAPTDGHRYEARILYSRRDPIIEEENSLPQALCLGQPCDRCFRTPALGATCEFALDTRVGTLVVYALIVDRALNGAGNDDDTLTPIALAMSDTLTLADGQQLAGVTLNIPNDITFTDVTVSLQPPVAFDVAVGIPGIDLGEPKGILVFDEPAFVPARLTSKVPAASGSLAGGTHMFFALTADELIVRPIPQSATILRGASLTGTVNLSNWLGVADQLALSAGTYSWTPIAGADVYLVFLTQASGARWSIGVLDGSTSFALPALSPDVLATGDTQMQVLALDPETWDPADFHGDDVFSHTIRTSQNRVTVVR